MNTRRLRGVTLVEVLVVVVVLAVVAALAAPAFTDMLNRRRVQAVAAAVSTDLAFLRTETALRPRDITMYFNMKPIEKGMSCYSIGTTQQAGKCNQCWIVDGSPCTGQAIELKTQRFPITGNVSFSPVGTWPPAAIFQGTLAFPSSDRLLPNPSDFAVDVCGAASTSPRPVLRIELNPMGRAKICSPNNSMSGYKNCDESNTPAPPPRCPTS